MDSAEDEELSDDDTPRASTSSQSPFRAAIAAPDIEHSSSPTEDVQEGPPIPSTVPSSAMSTPTPVGRTSSVPSIQSELQRLGPPPLPSHRRVFRKRREVLFRQVLKACIISAETTESVTLRSTIAEEVKAGYQGLLTTEEKDTRHTLATVRSRSRNYWSRIHQEVHYSSFEFRQITGYNQLYTPRDVERALFFWANHQHVLSYGEIAYELCLPLGVLLSWILRYVERI